MDNEFNQQLSLMQIEVPACPPAMIRYRLVETMGRFLRNTQLLTVELDTITTDADTTTHSLSLPSGWTGWKISKVLTATLDDSALYGRSDYSMSGTTFTWLITPNDDQDLDIKVCVELDDLDTAEPPDKLLPFLDGIRNGALVPIFAMKNWRDGQQAAFAMNEYNRAVTNAMYEAGLEETNEPVALSI